MIVLDAMKNLTEFIQNSPTAYQTTANIVNELESRGFERLNENEIWDLKPGKGYFTQRNMSSVIAFRPGTGKLSENGFLISGAHTDSPSLKIKSNGSSFSNGTAVVSTEVYGNPIISTWFDRELSFAGVVSIKKKNRTRVLFDYKTPIAVIPNLAIHMNRDVNKGFEYNKQTHLQAVLGIDGNHKDPLRYIIAEKMNIKISDIGDMDLFLYDPANGTILDNQYLVAPRVDNLAMCHSILTALLTSKSDRKTQAGVFYDNEEIGSLTYQGADSSYFTEILERIVIARGEISREDFFRAKTNSFFISADGAHGVHPNFKEKHDPDYTPKLNGGPVVKINAGYKYSTTSETAMVFRNLCEQISIPVQTFIGRSDMPGGGTIGAVSAAKLGIKTVDVGNPMWAMHSIRETYGLKDHDMMNRVLFHYYSKGI